MKIDLVLPSRGHPLRLMSVLTCFDALASGTHDITYRVVCDKDDPLTWKVCSQLPGLKIATHIGEGPLSKRMNEAAMESDAQIVSSAADDTFPLAQHWDMILEAGITQGHHAFSWQEANDPSNQTMIVFSRTWLKSAGRMIPEYFPFWFGDTWVAEVHELAFNRPMPIVENLPWGGKRGKTMGMRDLEFWFRFFAATRPEREAEARSLCFALGTPYEPAQNILPSMQSRDAYQLGRVPHYNEWFGADQGEPTEQYMSMKKTAEQWSHDGSQ